MSKVLFRFCAAVVFISLSVSVFFCIYTTPMEMSDMSHMGHVSTVSSHLDHIHLLTTALLPTLGILLLLIGIFFVWLFSLEENKSLIPHYFLYEEPPGIRLKQIISCVDNQRAPPF